MKVTVQSDKSPAEMEIILQKAVKSLQKVREKRPFEDGLQQPIQKVDKLVDLVLDNMIDEIVQVLDGDNSDR